MKSLAHPGSLAILSWLGKQGTRALAAVVIIGIALPQVGEIFKPYLTEAVFLLLCVAFLRADVPTLKRYCSRPAFLIAASVWTSIAIPAVVGAVGLIFDLPHKIPNLFPGLMLQAVASPIMAAPALAVLMGLDATLVLITLVISTALLPLTSSAFAFFFLGSTLDISPLLLALKLLLIISGASLTGALLRRWMGLRNIEKYAQEINGFNLIILFVFATALMQNVGVLAIKEPLETLLLTILAFLIFSALLISTTFLFLPAGRERALSLGFMVSQRNMGLMLAVTAGSLPEQAWLYFALAQFPIYLAPHFLKSAIDRLLVSDSA